MKGIHVNIFVLIVFLYKDLSPIGFVEKLKLGSYETVKKRYMDIQQENNRRLDQIRAMPSFSVD